MLNRIIHFSLHNKMLILIVTVLLLIVGVYFTTKTEVDVFPDLNAPTVTIMTEAPGLAPEEVEKLVSYPIESALNGATGVRRVRSDDNRPYVYQDLDAGFAYDCRQAYLPAALVDKRRCSGHGDGR